jgi:hypothetical protein
MAASVDVYMFNLRNEALACALQIETQLCSSRNYHGQYDELVAYLRSPNADEYHIEKARNLLAAKQGVPKINKLFDLLQTMYDNDVRSALRLPAFQVVKNTEPQIPESRWVLKGATIYVSNREWGQGRSASVVAPPPLFRIASNGAIEGASIRLHPFAVAFVETLTANPNDPEQYLRNLGKNSGVCPCCRRHVGKNSGEEDSHQGLHKRCEEIMGLRLENTVFKKVRP